MAAPRPEPCAKCQGIGWLLDRTGKAKPCVCRTAELALRQCEQYGLTQGAFAHMRLDAYDPDPAHPSQTNALNRARDRVRQWARGETWKGLMFVSPQPGLGKTHLAVGMAWEAALMGKSVAIFDMPNYFDDLLDAFDARNGGASTLRRTATDVDCLLLDDAGKEKRSGDLVERVYFGILNTRLNAHRTTILTSNHTPSELVGIIGSASVSRLAEMVGNKAVSMSGGDYRKRVSDA